MAEKTMIGLLQNSILNIFIEIYSITEKVNRRLITVEKDNNDPSIIGGTNYKFIIRGSDYVPERKKPRSRNITITPLQASGAKSIVFWVIYDNNLVLRFPPEKNAIRSSAEYLEYIRKEKKFVQGLPEGAYFTSCLYPLLTYFLETKNGLSKEEKENICLKKFEMDQDVQKYLVINGQYFFVTNLLKKPLLSEEIRSLEKIKKEKIKEVAKEDLLLIIENNLTDFVARHNIDNNDKHNLKTWKIGEIFKNIYNYTLNLSSNNSQSAISTMINFLTEDTSEIKFQDYNKSAIEEYKKIIEKKVEKKYVNRQIERIIFCLLESLVCLRKLEKFHRDLKPDNIFCNKAEDAFNSMIESLGLFDFETSGVVEKGKAVDQPQTGGTLKYASLVNFLPNDMFANPAEMLFAQDLKATADIIFEVCTFRPLYEETEEQLRNIIVNMGNAKEMGDFLKCITDGITKYWDTAYKEFTGKTKIYKRELDSIKITIKDEVKNILFLKELEKNNNHNKKTCLIEEKIEKWLNVFKNNEIVTLTASQLLEIMFILSRINLKKIKTTT